MSIIDLTGQIFGNLTVIERALNKGRRSAWRCRCICDNIKVIITEHLKRGATKSCGCMQFKHQIRENLLNRRFGRLLVISESDKIGNKYTWLCQCDCGNSKIIKAAYLQDGSTQSCGCLMLERAAETVRTLIKNNTKYSPKEAAARKIWKKSYPDMLFDDFYQMSQKDCYYCGQSPNQNIMKLPNYQINNDYSDEAREFRYNGIDRLDSTLGHINDNIVTCCWLCNRSKRNLHVDLFLKHVANIKINNNSPEQYRQNYKNIDLYKLTGSLKALVKKRFHSIYTDGDLSLEDFYRLSQLNCYYCNFASSNKCYGYKQVEYTYNGLDRVDSSRAHYFDNVVPCCKHCNFIKNNMTVEDFYTWVSKIITHMKL